MLEESAGIHFLPRVPLPLFVEFEGRRVHDRAVVA